jgi:hypothetical protein
MIFLDIPRLTVCKQVTDLRQSVLAPRTLGYERESGETKRREKHGHSKSPA